LIAKQEGGLRIAHSINKWLANAQALASINHATLGLRLLV
jgi:hypothetical protein